VLETADANADAEECEFDCADSGSLTLFGRYGDGPYYVQGSATVSGTPDSTMAFIVELASRRDMPHTVYTFLSLVRYGLLEHSALVSIDDQTLGIFPVDIDGSFDTKRKALGLAQSILMVEEHSPSFPCEKGSLRFHDNGPGLALQLSSTIEGTSCFGKIYEGIEHVGTLQESLANGHVIENVSFQFLQV
jgi:hypothetical protein